MKHFLAVAALALLAVAPQQSMQFNGVERTYRVYRPANLPLEHMVPLVVMLHGGFGNGAQAERAYGWDQEADRKGFVVVYPDGLNNAWNGGTCCGKPARDGVDDVGFLTALVKKISAEQNIDPSHIAFTGMSNGAIMSYRMACDSPLHLAAIGSVSGTMLVPCKHPQRTRVMEIHGTADHNIPYNGGVGQGVGHVTTAPIPSVLDTWFAIDDCPTPSSTTRGEVTTKAARCANGTAVTFISVAGAGHQWPGSHPPPRNLARLTNALGIHGLDTPSTALDATQELYDFFW